jgi:hypothetical protein
VCKLWYTRRGKFTTPPSHFKFNIASYILFQCLQSLKWLIFVYTMSKRQYFLKQQRRPLADIQCTITNVGSIIIVYCWSTGSTITAIAGNRKSENEKYVANDLTRKKFGSYGRYSSPVNVFKRENSLRTRTCRYTVVKTSAVRSSSLRLLMTSRFRLRSTFLWARTQYYYTYKAELKADYRPFYDRTRVSNFHCRVCTPQRS